MAGLAVDFVIRFEELHRDIRAVEERCEIEIASRLPNAKGEFRSDKRPAKDILSKRQKGVVREYCRDEFEFFDFEE